MPVKSRWSFDDQETDVDNTRQAILSIHEKLRVNWYHTETSTLGTENHLYIHGRLSAVLKNHYIWWIYKWA